MAKFAHLQEILAEDGTLALGALHQSEPIDDFLLHLVHDPAWVSAVRNGTWEKQAARRVGLPWSPGLAKRTFLAVGGRGVRLNWLGKMALLVTLPEDSSCICQFRLRILPV